MKDKPRPDRRVEYDDDVLDDEFGPLIGEAQTLPMTAKQMREAKTRRRRLDALGGFGFRA